MIKTKITNPTDTKKSYTWFPRGLVLGPKESRMVDCDPYSNCPNKMQLGILSNDVLKGNVELTYYVEAPCKIALSDEIKTPVKKEVAKAESTKQESAVEPIDVSNQIKAGLDEVKDNRDTEPVVSLMDNKEVSTETVETIDLMNGSELTDKQELLVTVSNEDTTTASTEVIQNTSEEADAKWLDVSVASTPAQKEKPTKAKKAKA